MGVLSCMYRFYTHHYEQYMDASNFTDSVEVVEDLIQSYQSMEGATQPPPVTRLKPRGTSFM